MYRPCIHDNWGTAVLQDRWKKITILPVGVRYKTRNMCMSTYYFQIFFNRIPAITLNRKICTVLTLKNLENCVNKNEYYLCIHFWTLVSVVLENSQDYHNHFIQYLAVKMKVKVKRIISWTSWLDIKYGSQKVTFSVFHHISLFAQIVSIFKMNTLSSITVCDLHVVS